MVSSTEGEAYSSVLSLWKVAIALLEQNEHKIPKSHNTH